MSCFIINDFQYFIVDVIIVKCIYDFFEKSEKLNRRDRKILFSTTFDGTAVMRFPPKVDTVVNKCVIIKSYQTSQYA